MCGYGSMKLSVLTCKVGWLCGMKCIIISLIFFAQGQKDDYVSLIIACNSIITKQRFVKNGRSC